MKVYDILINIIKQAIQDDDLDELELNLMRLPLEKLNQKILDELLATFLNHCLEYNNILSVKKIFDVWYKMLSVETGQLDHLTRIFLDPAVNDKTKVLVAQTYMDERPIEYYMEKLIDYDSLAETLVAAKILDSIFPTNYHAWHYLYELSVENEIEKGYTNYLVKDYIKTRMVEKDKFIKPPRWIINEYNHLPTESELMEKINLDIPEYPTEEIIRDLSLTPSQFEQFTNQQKRTILQKYDKQKYRLGLNYNNELTKTLGPANTQLSEDLTEDHICTIYGGHRMLTCFEFEDQYLNDEEVDDFDANYNDESRKKTEWFHYGCDWCENKIQHKHYAVRKPLYTGGWIGCYCSIQCIRDSLNVTDVMEQELVNILEEELYNVGIQDRKY